MLKKRLEQEGKVIELSLKMRLVFVVVKVKRLFRTLHVFNQPLVTNASDSDKIGVYLIALETIFLSQPCCLFKEPIVLAQSFHHTPYQNFLLVIFFFNLHTKHNYILHQNFFKGQFLCEVSKTILKPVFFK